MKSIVLLLLPFIIVFTCCSKSGNEKSSGSTGSTGVLQVAGYGRSTQPFTDASWQLPAGIELEDSIHEFSYCWALPPYTQVPPGEWKGLPLGFSFCMTLRNSTTQTIIIHFPPALIYTSSSLQHQNVLTIDLGDVEVLPGSSKTIVTQAFCVNLGRTIPETYVENTENFLTYSFGPSKIPGQLQEIVDILVSKHITMKDVLKADGTMDNDKTQKYAIIPEAIWEVTDKEGLTTETKNQLRAL